MKEPNLWKVLISPFFAIVQDMIVDFYFFFVATASKREIERFLASSIHRRISYIHPTNRPHNKNAQKDTPFVMELGVKQESFRMEVLMKNLQSECFNVCVPSMKGDELTVDEVNCLDKCSWKYLKTDKLVDAALERGARQVNQAVGADAKRR
ncbi:zinc finger protein, putative [Bodo saltans]|uniref:Zinc finger protein, putative n=1 Tax=Bodo saltans TaxID=75058 RepID=A0A0S4JN37_BODSA|nr:zinc finger protein, putative [Bodo saltans]|eukprot:CUG92947.1 zinc finger protein, putative [Bodo saltans]